MGLGPRSCMNRRSGTKRKGQLLRNSIPHPAGMLRFKKRSSARWGYWRRCRMEDRLEFRAVSVTTSGIGCSPNAVSELSIMAFVEVPQFEGADADSVELGLGIMPRAAVAWFGHQDGTDQIVPQSDDASRIGTVCDQALLLVAGRLASPSDADRTRRFHSWPRCSQRSCGRVDFFYVAGIGDSGNRGDRSCLDIGDY